MPTETWEEADTMM